MIHSYYVANSLPARTPEQRDASSDPRNAFPLTHLSEAVVRGIEIAFECHPSDLNFDEWLEGARSDYLDCETLNDICAQALCSPRLASKDREPLLVAYLAVNALLCLNSSWHREAARTSIENLYASN